MKEKSLIIEGTKKLIRKSKEEKELLKKEENTALVKPKKTTKSLVKTNKSEDEKIKKEVAPKLTKKTATKSKKEDSEKVTAKKVKSSRKVATTKTDKTKTLKTTAKKTTKKSSTTSKVKKSPSKSVKKTTKTLAKEVTMSAHANEYFDLPYRYNETLVKLLAQTPNRLFVYWDISDMDRENYIKYFGEDFFYKTVPFLRIKNETNNYTFEVEINDFANSWYIEINDDNCKYTIELYRKFREHEVNETVINAVQSFNELKNHEVAKNNNYIFVASSNQIDAPNGKVVSTMFPRTVEFVNVKNSEKSYKVIDKPEVNEFYDTFYKDEFDGEFKGLPSSR